MASYYVKTTGSNTAPYDNWTKAATSLATIIALPPAAGDTVYVDSAYAPATGAGINWSVVNNVRFISTSDTTNTPPTTYAAGASIDASATGGADISINGGHWYGFTFKSGSGAAVCDIQLGTSSGMSMHFEECKFYTGGSSSSTRVYLGTSSTSSGRYYIRTKNCEFHWGHTGHGIFPAGLWEDEGSDLCASATIPGTLIRSVTANVRLQGSDLSDIAGTLVQAAQGAYSRIELWACKMNAAVTLLGTSPSANGAEVFTYDCSDGDTHYNFTHDNAWGTTRISTSIVMNTSDAAKYDGTNAHTWVVTGSTNATLATPYMSPWIDVYHDGTASITPYLEIVRDGSSTAFTNNEVWADWMAKTTTTSTRATFYSDRGDPLNSADQSDGAGLASWTGENATSKSMKLDSGAAFTPAEIGHMRARVCVAGNLTAYVNPKILGR